MCSDDIRPTDPAAYAFWVDDVIRFSDQDPGGHVNNVAFAAYVEHGRVAIMRAAGFERAAPSRFVLAHLEIDFLAEAHFPGRLRIGTRVERIGNSSITYRAAVFQDGRCLATARSVIVHKLGDAAAPLPEAARRAVEAMA
jgi:acyl-CoA thioester hydrolase